MTVAKKPRVIRLPRTEEQVRLKYEHYKPLAHSLLVTMLRRDLKHLADCDLYERRSDLDRQKATVALQALLKKAMAQQPT